MAGVLRNAACAGPHRLKVFYNDVFVMELPKNHRFPMKKYAMARRELMARLHTLAATGEVDLDGAPEVSGEGFTIGVADFEVSPMATEPDLLTTHCPVYINRYQQAELSADEIRKVGFPWSDQGVKRTFSSAGGTVGAARALFDGPYWVSAHMAGGTHHAFYDRGEGYCVFNDIAVAANVVWRDHQDAFRLDDGGYGRMLVIDLDVHQGNGTAELFQGSDDVITFSMHCEQNLFSKREVSHYDVDLRGIGSDDAGMRIRMAKSSCDPHFHHASFTAPPPGGDLESQEPPPPQQQPARFAPPLTPDDTHYLSVLANKLDAIFADAAEAGRPYKLVFYQAGVDPHIDDKLGRLCLTRAGLRARNELVYHKVVVEHGCKLCITMGGGYPKDMDVDSELFRNLTKLHADVYWQAAEFCRRRFAPREGAARAAAA